MKSIDIDIDVNRAIENARLSFEEPPNAILRRLLAIDARRPAGSVVPRSRAARSSGAYMTVLGKTPVEANSLKELLRRAILIAEKSSPGVIEKLAKMPTPKGRYIVARTAASLYPKSPQLVEYADRLNGAWWYDTNVGRSQVAAYFKVLSRLLKLPQLPTIQKRSEKSALTLEDLGLA